MRDNDQRFNLINFADSRQLQIEKKLRCSIINNEKYNERVELCFGNYSVLHSKDLKKKQISNLENSLIFYS